MKKVFIETLDFSARLKDYLTEENYREFQNLLMSQPDLGRVVSGCNGLRKIRVADSRRGKGKRGGIRILYLHVPEVNRIYLVGVYDKGERDEINAQQKKLLVQVVQRIKLECVNSIAAE